MNELHELLLKMSTTFEAQLAEVNQKIDRTKQEINESNVKRIQELNTSSGQDNEYVHSHFSEQRIENLDTANIRKETNNLVDLPVFDGKSSEWPMFLAQFKQTTEMFKYDNVDNNIRLNKALVGPAKSLIGPLLIHPRNVPQIMEDLEERFGSSDLLVEDQLKALRAFPSIGESKIHLLVEFADKVRNFKNFLISSECESYLDNPLLVKEIIEKIPINSRIEWAKKAATFSRKAT